MEIKIREAVIFNLAFAQDSRIALTPLGLGAKFWLRRRRSIIPSASSLPETFPSFTLSTLSNNNLTTTLLVFLLYLFRPLLIDLERLFLSSLASVSGFAKVASKTSNLHLSTPVTTFQQSFQLTPLHDHSNSKTFLI
jgi:hypothetical protein